MACELHVAHPVQLKTVQVAIQDPEYADSIRNLLLQDGGHRVRLVTIPDLTSAGVIVVDAIHLSSFPWLANERERLVVIVHKDCVDLSKVWEAGVRHVVFHGDAPQSARVVVIAVELALPNDCG
jgi:hypothetical protein